MRHAQQHFMAINGQEDGAPETGAVAAALILLVERPIIVAGICSLCFGSLVKQEEQRRGEATVHAKGNGTGGADVPIPYRYSNLTRILARSLHSDASIVLLVTLNPACTATQLSLHAIDFAQRASCLRERPIRRGGVSPKQFLLRQYELLKELRRAAESFKMARLCLQQLPGASLHSAEERQEAIQLHQELQHQFELLNNILVRQMGLHYCMLPTGMLELDEVETRTLRGKLSQEKNGDNCARSSLPHGSSTVHQKQSVSGNDLEILHSTTSQPLRHGELTSESLARCPVEKVSDWLPYCERSQKAPEIPQENNCSSFSMVDEQMESQKGVPTGRGAGICSDDSSQSSSFNCLQQQDVVRERPPANKATTSTTSVILNPSEDGSSTVHSMERTNTESQTYLQQSEASSPLQRLFPSTAEVALF
ncbi:uncharacterized protein EMH_0028910 [Eimeria mitis]|uniref:Kinesin motor domain-containing protein n=1 Tax=Eimeria mitis TaxID=44415 RepID=U6KIH3_9EIME|nr:uncharacterized protein EMH_0028910 [Eimeria mitis]CDJ36052.1 hypothetical protein, conserved [Eimeria mitis]